MSSPNIESHLVISVGENYYCALAKGPLVQDHILIIPVEHSPSTLSLPSECETELAKFQGSLKKYHNNNEKEVVFFEWASKRSTHANLQVKGVALWVLKSDTCLLTRRFLICFSLGTTNCIMFIALLLHVCEFCTLARTVLQKKAKVTLFSFCSVMMFCFN